MVVICKPRSGVSRGHGKWLLVLRPHPARRLHVYMKPEERPTQAEVSVSVSVHD